MAVATSNPSMEFIRESRLPVPSAPHGELTVDAPPAVPKSVPPNPVARLLPVAMVVAAVGMMAVYFTSGTPTVRSPMLMFFPVMMVVSVLGSVAYGARNGNRSAEINQDRQRYLRYLDTLDAAIATAANDQHWSLHWQHPDPSTLWTLAGTRRMWERQPGDTDFGEVRAGVGDRDLATTLKAPKFDTAQECDPVTTGAVRRLLRTRSVVPHAPVTVPLPEHAAVTVCGEPARSVMRAMVCQLAVLHGPEHVSIAVTVGPSARAEWDWLKWLPHYGGHASRTLMVVDGATRAPSDGVTVLEVGTGLDDSDRVEVRMGDRIIDLAQPDSLTGSQALICARRLAPYHAAVAPAQSHPVREWLELMGLDGLEELTPPRRWVSDGLLPVPIGVDERGAPVMLDINEAARNGMGPHGLCVGATGSGKSELLRTLVLGMITRHSPDVLNLVLVDFKGGATFLGLERARHVAAVITNLADEAHLVARMNDALSGEITRRQGLLRAAGSFANVTEYERARAAGADLAPLPALFVVVDEFSELLTQHPEFADLFVAIGRLGRSLGVHLLLASQRLDEGRLRGLETHLSYRICLKTFSASESRAVLGVPDAYHLPGTPGAAYLKTSSAEAVRFQTAYVSGACAGLRVDAPPTPPAMPRLFTAWPVDGQLDRMPVPAAVGTPTGALLDAVVERVAGQGIPAHPVWLPPLTAPPTLEALMRGGAARGMAVPIGVVDKPFEQRRDPLVVDLAGAAGNVVIVGAPRSGKSTAVRTLLLGLAEMHSPAQVGFYCLDFGGGGLSALRGLPHVGSVAGRNDVDLCRRTVAVVESVIRSREARSDDAYGEVFLVVDGWATLRQEFDGLEGPITAIAAQGLSFGVHVVVTASRWAELRPALKDQIATRIELRLGDPAESEMDRKRARQLMGAPPGRGLTADGKELTIAIPDVDGARLLERWHGHRTPPVELLPARVDHLGLIDDANRPAASLVIGMGERDLAPVSVDFGRHSHLLVLGETGCGKTSLLRLLCREIIRRNGPERARVEIVDFRRSLLGVVESEHLDGYTVSPLALTTRIGMLLDRLRNRMPDENVTQQQLRTRSWWTGPDIYLVIDDYDLVAAATGNPLVPLADFLPYAHDLGLHVIVARRSGGAARAMFDPVLARLRELGCMGLMMSAAPDEGVLLGTVRPASLPPGRGTLIVRGEADQLVQVAWTDPP